MRRIASDRIKKIASDRKYRLIKKAGYYEEDDGKTVYFRALHRNILVAYVATPGIDWKAYIFPVPGENHEEEARLWRTEGTQIAEYEAKALWGAIAEKYENEDMHYRR